MSNGLQRRVQSHVPEVSAVWNWRKEKKKRINMTIADAILDEDETVAEDIHFLVLKEVHDQPIQLEDRAFSLIKFTTYCIEQF